MEDVKWLIKKYGFFIVLMVIIVIIGSIVLGKRGSEKNAEEVWEPPVEILSDHTSVPVGNEEVISGNNIVEEGVEENETESETSLWFLPQAENCLITETEKDELKDTALTAAEQVREVYKGIELISESSYGSNIKEFTREQCREVVALLGKAGYVSVTEDTNMENYENVEDFYADYMEKRDAMVTIFDVNRDGLIGAVTFIYRNNELQTYYVGIGWQEGGIPEIKDTLVSDIAEIKLTEKGYFIYAHEELIAHSSLRQYWRIKPLSDKCRELTAKYVYGLSYVNYNVLVTNWDSSNVEDILMPCMFEDIYRIYTGEILRTENWRIPADTYEKIMTTYFPVSIEQLREKCGYDENSNSYEYEMIFASPYPPFGEVVDYTENPDGTITLIVDGVWADYNSEGKTHEQILAEGGIELSCTITEDNQFSGTLFSQQEITERFALIEDISGKVEQAELYFDYTDDEWGNSGTLHIQFLSDRVYVEVLNYKKADNGSDYSISGSFELIRQKEDVAGNGIADNSNYNSSWTEEEIIRAVNERSQYYKSSAYYSEIIEYWEDVREVRDISNVLEPLFETDKKYYTKEEFESEPMLVIHLAKNEIYARHGYRFTNQDLYNYFMGCIWYNPTCDGTDFDDSIFNEYEKANLEILANLDTY